MKQVERFSWRVGLVRICTAGALLLWVRGGTAAEGVTAQITLRSLWNKGATNAELPALFHRNARQWTVEFREGAAEFGAALASAGDVNGDGYPDLAVGAYRSSIPTTSTGRLFLFRGGPGGIITTPWAIRNCVRAGANFAKDLAAGDFNADGFSDVATSAARYDQRGRDGGHAFAYYGSVSGIAEMFDWDKPSPIVNASFANAFVVGDVNGDGFADLIVGARSMKGRFSREGAVYVFCGSSQGLAATAISTNWGGQLNSMFGCAVTCVGDINRDGYHDVLVGASDFNTTNLPQVGRAFLFLGSAQGLREDATWTVTGPAAGVRLGFALAVLGDINEDGFPEVAISAPGATASKTAPGMVMVYQGSASGFSTEPVWTATGDQPGIRFGLSVSSAGDVNGDGRPDLLIGAPLRKELTAEEGRVYLYLTKSNALPAAPDWIADGGVNLSILGNSLSGLGDVNRDGFDDFAVSAPGYHYNLGKTKAGRVDVFYGAAVGYGFGQSFPADSISAVQGSPSPPPPPKEIVTIHVPVPGPGRVFDRRLFLAMGLAAVGIALLLWQFVVRRQRAVQKSERSRIARDIHDDLGARFTHLTMLMDMAGRHPPGSPDALKLAGEIRAASHDISSSMEQVMWSENPANDSLENLVTFIVQYAGPYLAPASIRCRCEAPTHLPPKPLAPEVRKNLFMAVKEALHNVAKHSGASEVQIDITFADSMLVISVRDNGRGFLAPDGQNAKAPTRTGNGLGNMRDRMAQLRGSFEMDSLPGIGTRVSLKARV